MNTFLPADYSLPKGNNRYMKLEKGENVFRILSPAITGWEYWTTDSKPIRSRTPIVGVPKDAKLADDGTFKPKHFWAFVVWNEKAQAIQILEVTQMTIQKFIQSTTEDAEWGDYAGYDFKITRDGDGFDTEYTCAAKPPKAMKPEVSVALAKEKINLDALFEGGDPFTSEAVVVKDVVELEIGEDEVAF